MATVQYHVKSLHFGRVFHVSPHQTSIYYYFQIAMSRQPLGEISGNSNYRGGTEGRFELTPYWRSHIVGRAAAGQSSKGIATDLNIPPLTVEMGESGQAPGRQPIPRQGRQTKGMRA